MTATDVRTQAMARRIEALERRERELAKRRRRTANEERQLLEAKLDLAFRRGELAQLEVELRSAAVQRAREQLVNARARGENVRQAQRAFDEAQQALADPELQLEAEVCMRQYQDLRRQWTEHRDAHLHEMLADYLKLGDELIEEGQQIRSKMGALEERWRQLAQEMYFAERRSYSTNLGGAADVPGFAGWTGSFERAVPRSLRTEPRYAVGASERLGGAA